MNLFKSLVLVAATAAITLPAIASADDWGHRDFRRDGYHRDYGYRPVVYRGRDWDYFHRPYWAHGWDRDRWEHHRYDRDRFAYRR